MVYLGQHRPPCVQHNLRKAGSEHLLWTATPSELDDVWKAGFKMSANLIFELFSFITTGWTWDIFNWSISGLNGAEIVFTPCATTGEINESTWGIEAIFWLILVWYFSIDLFLYFWRREMQRLPTVSSPAPLTGSAPRFFPGWSTYVHHTYRTMEMFKVQTVKMQIFMFLSTQRIQWRWWNWSSQRARLLLRLQLCRCSRWKSHTGEQTLTKIVDLWCFYLDIWSLKCDFFWQILFGTWSLNRDYF